MDADSADDPNLIQWRRDAGTARTVGLLWSLGVGTFFAMISIVVLWRFYDLAGQLGLETVVLAVTAGLVVTILTVSLSRSTTEHAHTVATWLSIEPPSERSIERATDAAVGTVVMGIVIATLMGMGRLVAEGIFLAGVGPGPFTGLAAITLPLALVALVAASFLSSTGTLDRETATLSLDDGEVVIDLEYVTDVSRRSIGEAAILKLTYAQPDGQYVPGPRRVVLPPAVADELETLIE